MSVEMMALVFKSFPGTGGEFALALALADHAHDDGTHIYPSVAALAEKSRQSESTVKRQLREFRRVGWLISLAGEVGGRGVTRAHRINPDWIERAMLNKRRKGVNMTPFGASGDALDASSPTPLSDSENGSCDVAEGAEEPDDGHRLPATQPFRDSVAPSSVDHKGGHPDPVSRETKPLEQDAKEGQSCDLLSRERGSPETEKGVTAMTPESSENHQKKNPQTRAPAREGGDDDPNDQEKLDQLQAAYPENTHPKSHWLIGRREASRRIAEGFTWAQLFGGVERMKAQKSAQGKLGSQYVPSPKNFFVRDREHPEPLFLDPFPIEGARAPVVRGLLDELKLAKAMPGVRR